jgi:hypothetical protein
MKKAAFLILLAFQFFITNLQADTVVGIHGFLSTTRSLKSVEETLMCAGFNVCLWEYKSTKKLIEEHACDLVILLQRIACDCPGMPIHFVTHSIGALILRCALNMPLCPQEAKLGKIVLVAPPNQGSCLAHRFSNFPPVVWALGNRSGWEIMHYGPCEIAAHFGEIPTCIPVLVIAGTRGSHIWFHEPNDGFLSIAETRLNTPFYFLSFPLTHGDLLKTPAVLCNIRSFICGDIQPCPAPCAGPCPSAL